jgi:hypothetical protein
LGEAEQWKDLAHLEVGDRFQVKPIHPGPVAMGRNTIEGGTGLKRTSGM